MPRTKRRVRVAPVPREPAPGKLAYDVAEAAWVLGIAVGTTWSLIYNGELATARVGRRVLVSRAEVERFLAAGGVRGARGEPRSCLRMTKSGPRTRTTPPNRGDEGKRSPRCIRSHAGGRAL